MRAKIVGMMMVRNEDWILGLSLRAALEWCDQVIVLIHQSTDQTRQIIHDVHREVGNRLVWTDGWGRTWREMAFRDHMLAMASGRNATHAAIVDADEVLTANLLPEIRGFVQELAPREVLELPMIPAWRSLERYRDDRSVWSRSMLSLAVGMDDGLHYAARGPEGYDFHNRIPAGAITGREKPPHRPLVGLEGGGVFHLQFVNWPRLTWKHTLYKMTEVLRWPGREEVRVVDRKYEQALDEDRIVTAAVPDEWWETYRDRGWLEHVETAGEPWQKAECLRLLELHGRERFAGLRLTGIDEPQGVPA